MALIVEDGSIVAWAESFCSVTFADGYLSARGYTLWAGLTPDQKEQALRRAADYIEQAYSSRWDGYRTRATQALSWPRQDVPMKDAGGERIAAYYAPNEVPVSVQQAQAAMAFKAAAGDLNPDLARAVQSETIGPISTTYSNGSPQFTRYRAIDGMLAPLLRDSSGAGFRIVRA